MRASSRAAALALLVFLSLPTAQAAIDPEAMQDLRRQFAERIGKKMQEADQLMQSPETAPQEGETATGSIIPEGEPLILQGVLGDKSLPLEREIIVVRQNGRLLASLSDVATALELPLTVLPAEGTASGWLVRQDQPFLLDAKSRTVTIAGIASTLAPEDVSMTPDDIMVSVALIEKWAGMKMAVDVPSMNVAFISAQPLPIEQKQQRKKQQKYTASNEDVARLPLQKEPYRIFSKPYLDANIGFGSSRPDGASPMRSASSWSTIGAGDMLGLSSRVFASGTWNSDGTGEPLNALRLTFGREDADGGVFGLPGVRNLEFGDVETVNLSLLGGTRQEQGVYISNRIPGDITTQSRMDIRGDSLPGWDVELYNNESLLGLQTVGDDGRYIFPSVFLFEGENVMRLVFYGPQGEKREETRRIVSHASTLEEGQGKWEVSATRTNEATYDAFDANSPVDGDPRISARYEHSLGPQASFNIGATHRSELGVTDVETKDYVQGGIATNFFGTLLTTDVAYDTDGEYLADILARRSFGQHQTGLQFQHSSGEFPQGGLNVFAPENLVRVNARGPFADSFLGLSNISYSADAGMFSHTDGSRGHDVGASLSGRTGNLSVNTSLNYANAESLGVWTPPELRLSGATSVVAGLGRGRLRLSSDYGFQPLDLRTVQANYTYPFTRKVQGIAEVTHHADASLTEFELSARWRHDKFVLSPRVAVDTDEALAMGVNMSFSLANDPYGEGYSMYGRNLSDAGGVSARVFLDKNGDGIFNGGDELLPDVDVRALQSSGKATTGGKGTAFIPSLQRGIRTDIVVLPETLPDPYYMTSIEGHSVRPRRGVTSPLDFPVVVAGELDGQVGFESAGGKPPGMRGVRVRLLAPDGATVQESVVGSDGYYSMSGIRPGVYYLLAEKGQGGGSATPKPLVFPAEGATYFGENILLTPGDATQYAFSATNDSPAVKNPGRVVRKEDIAGRRMLIHVGEYRSKLALSLGWYRFRMMSGVWERNFTLATPVPEETADPRTQTMGITLKPTQPVGMSAAVEACRALQEQSYKCRIEIITTYHDPAPEPPLTPAAVKKTAEIAPVAVPAAAEQPAIRTP